MKLGKLRLTLVLALASAVIIASQGSADVAPVYPNLVGLMENAGQDGWKLTGIVFNDPNNFSHSSVLAPNETEWDPALPVSSDPNAWNLITVFDLPEIADIANGVTVPAGITANNLSLNMHGTDAGGPLTYSESVSSLQFQDAFNNWYTPAEFEAHLVASGLFDATRAAAFVAWFQSDPAQSTPPSQADVDDAKQASGDELNIKITITATFDLKVFGKGIDGEVEIVLDGPLSAYVEGAEDAWNLIKVLLGKIRDYFTSFWSPS